MYPLRSLIEQSFHVFIELNWQITILAIVIGLAALLSRKTSSTFRYWLWCILLIRLCIPLNLSLPYGMGDNLQSYLLSIPDYFTTQETATAPLAFEDPTPSLLPAFNESIPGYLPAANIKSAEYTEPIAEVAPPLSWQEIAMMGWLCVFLMLVSLIGWWLLRVRRILRQARPVERPELIALMERIHTELGLKRTIQLRCLSENNFFGPAVVGLFRPTIYLPRSIAESWPVEDIEPVLLHELVHVKRGDLLVNWLQIVVQAAWFFHPLVWLANREIRRLREDICDDMAIRGLGKDRERYTGNMLRVVKAMNQTPAGSLLMLGFTETQKSLTRRIMRIMSDTYRNHPRLTGVSVTLLVIVMAASMVLASGKLEAPKSAEDFQKSNYGTALEFYPEEMTWDEIVSVVKEEGKPGLLYFSSLCGVCRWVEEEVYSDTTCATQLDSNYTLFWVESTKGNGADLSKRFDINGTPAFVLLDADGAYLNKRFGYGGKRQMLIDGLIEATSRELLDLRASYTDDPQNTTLALQYADALYLSDEWAEALPVYELLLKQPMDDSTAVNMYMKTSTCYRQTNDEARYRELLEAGLQAGHFTREKDMIHCLLARSYFKDEEYPKALEYYKLVPESWKDFPVYNGFGGDEYGIKFHFGNVKRSKPIAHIKAGEVATGREMLAERMETVAALKSTNALADQIATCLSSDVYLEEILPYAHQLNERTKWKQWTHIWRYAELLQKTGDYHQAIEVYQKASDAAKQEQWKDHFKYSLLVLHYQAGLQEIAETLERQMVAAVGNDVYKASSMAREFVKFGLYTKALPWAQKTAELSALEYREFNSRASLFDLYPGFGLEIYAEALFETGNIDEAIKVQISALAVARDEDSRRRYRKALEKYRAAALNVAPKPEGQAHTTPETRDAQRTKNTDTKALIEMEQETFRRASEFFSDSLYEQSIAEYEKVLRDIEIENMTASTQDFSIDDLRMNLLFGACLRLAHAYSKVGNDDKGRETIRFAVTNLEYEDSYTNHFRAAQHCSFNNIYPDLAMQLANDACEMSDWQRAPALSLYARLVKETGQR